MFKASFLSLWCGLSCSTTVWLAVNKAHDWLLEGRGGICTNFVFKAFFIQKSPPWNVSGVWAPSKENVEFFCCLVFLSSSSLTSSAVMISSAGTASSGQCFCTLLMQTRPISNQMKTYRPDTINSQASTGTKTPKSTVSSTIHTTCVVQELTVLHPNTRVTPHRGCCNRKSVQCWRQSLMYWCTFVTCSVCHVFIKLDT